MLTLKETKEFLRIDSDEEDVLLSKLIMTAKELIEGVVRKPINDFEEIPTTIRQAMLIIVATLYEERQISKSKTGINVTETLDLVRRMLFAYREDKF